MYQLYFACVIFGVLIVKCRYICLCLRYGAMIRSVIKDIKRTNKGLVLTIIKEKKE
jgi:hypothetical protein